MRTFYYRSFITSKLRVTRRGYYNNDGGGAGDGSGGGGGNDDPLNKKVDLTQKQLNDIVAAEKRKAEQAAATATKKTVEELEKVKSTATLSQQQAEDLQKQIAELEKTYMSKEELAKREAEKTAKEYNAKLESATKAAETNEKRFKNLLVKQAITKAAAENDAYRAEQMLTQLGGLAKVVPVIVDGKETEDFEVKILFPDTTKEGQAVVLDLTADAAMKRMKELPDLYGNFFKSGVNGGVGGGNAGGGNSGGGSKDLNTLTQDPEAYRKARKDLLK
jgi:hypothetical protein